MDVLEECEECNISEAANDYATRADQFMFGRRSRKSRFFPHKECFRGQLFVKHSKVFVRGCGMFNIGQETMLRCVFVYVVVIKLFMKY